MSSAIHKQLAILKRDFNYIFRFAKLAGAIIGVVAFLGGYVCGVSRGQATTTKQKKVA